MKRAMIGLIAAMPEEIRPLLKTVTWDREKIGQTWCYRFSVGSRDMVLVESGMGMHNAAAAASLLMTSYDPAVIINFGFAGAVAPGLEVGDIIVAHRCLWRHEHLCVEQQGIDLRLADQTVALLSTQKKTHQVVGGTFITTSGIDSKAEVLLHLPHGTTFPAVEMETAAIARSAARRLVPLVGIRAISDDAGEELGFSIEEFTDRQMRIRIAKVLLTVARKPMIIPQLLRLSRNTRSAGLHLATAVRLVLDQLVLPRQ